jgi:hypothetical protein
MGVYTSTYILLGVKLPMEDGEEFYDKYEKYMDDSFNPRQKGLVVLYDGMSGEYIFIGHVIDSFSNDDDGCLHNPVKIEYNTPDQLAVAKDLRDKFNIEDAEISHWVVSHSR